MRSLLSKKAGGLSWEARGVALIPFTVAEKARTVGLNRPGFGYLRMVFHYRSSFKSKAQRFLEKSARLPSCESP